MFDYFHFRYRRFLRRFRRDARIYRKWSVNYIDRHIWGKWHQLGVMRRFLLVWLGIFIIAFIGLFNQMGALQQLTRALVAVPGGNYSEAVVGELATLNPILANNEAEYSADRLIFSGLTRYDSQRKLVGDLANSWSVSTDGKVYTFNLRKGVKWQDGVPFSATDVVFTLAAIQNPDSRSPLSSSWQGVKAEAKGDSTVVFTLPSPLNSFLDSTTMAIVPRHILEGVEPSRLAEADFNQSPIGTGPFKVKTFVPATKEITLEAYGDYHFGKPKLDEFILREYNTSKDALDAFAAQEVMSPGQVTASDAKQAKSISRLVTVPMTLPVESTLFFQNNDPLLKDKTLRSILSRAINRQAVLDAAEAGKGIVVSQPLLPGQVGYTAKYAPGELNPAAAQLALASAGWALPNGKQVRSKDGKELTITIVTLANSELETAANEIAKQWSKIGVKTVVVTKESTELQQSYMRPRNFQALLFGVNLGADPDVYSFWHSSQAKDPGVNLSSYASATADKALEAGRLKSDPLIRQGKYMVFLKAWNEDAPAAVLYQTGYDYGTIRSVHGITARRLVTPADRYYDVQLWTMKERWSTK